MNTNPYEVTSTFADLDARPQDPLGFLLLGPSDQRAFDKGARTIGLFLGLMAVMIFVQTILFFATKLGLNDLVLAPTWFCLVGVWVNALRWCRIPGRHRNAAIAACVLMFVSVPAGYVAALRVVELGYAHGFVALFGASAFATILFSQVILQLLLVSRARSLGCHDAAVWGLLAAIANAIAGSVCSLFAMKVLANDWASTVTGVAMLCVACAFAMTCASSMLVYKVAANRTDHSTT